MRTVIRIVPVLLSAVFLILAGCESSDDSSASSSSSVPDCSGGSEAGVFEGDVPSWIEDNFTCVAVTADGDDLVIETRDMPPYTSYYYGSDSDRYDPTTPTTPNPNKIEEQTIVMTVTASPASGGGGASGLGIVGIATDGTVIFNDEANPPDVLADEADTFDVNDGHPTSNGVYHYHTEPPQLTSDDDAVVGIAIDGFPIFGKQNNQGAHPFTGEVDNFHADNDTDYFSDGTPHYHIVFNNPQSQSDSDSVDVDYMIGGTLGGAAGTVEGGN